MGYRIKQRILNLGTLNVLEAPKEIFNILRHQRNVNQNDPESALVGLQSAKTTLKNNLTIPQKAGHSSI